MSKSDRNSEYMKETWGTEFLCTDYGSVESIECKEISTKNEDKIKYHDKKMLREISNDDITPKKHNFDSQNEIHEKIRNDNDYDDWEYGTEPLPLKNWK